MGSEHRVTLLKQKQALENSSQMHRLGKAKRQGAEGAPGEHQQGKAWGSWTSPAAPCSRQGALAARGRAGWSQAGSRHCSVTDIHDARRRKGAKRLPQHR